MYLIVGLGNPGLQYAYTRHNAGFMLLDYLAENSNASFAESKWKALITKTIIWDKTFILLKPQTYMNASGTAVGAVRQYYKLSNENILVIHDDLDIPLGRIKIVTGGGAGGHKGVLSCIEHLGTKNFPRIKIGIGRPAALIPPEKYVLSRFEPGEHEVITRKMEVAAEGIRIFVQQGISAAMNALNKKE